MFFIHRSGRPEVLTEACNFIKKGTPIKVFSCYFCKIFEDTFFYRASPVAASEYFLYTWLSNSYTTKKPEE